VRYEKKKLSFGDGVVANFGSGTQKNLLVMSNGTVLGRLGTGAQKNQIFLENGGILERSGSGSKKKLFRLVKAPTQVTPPPVIAPPPPPPALRAPDRGALQQAAGLTTAFGDSFDPVAVYDDFGNILGFEFDLGDDYGRNVLANHDKCPVLLDGNGNPISEAEIEDV